MIRYKLQCKKGHEFEAWFASSDVFDRQKKKGQLACPSCGTRSVSKALMAPNVTPRSKRKAALEPQQPPASPGCAASFGYESALTSPLPRLNYFRRGATS